MDDERVQKLACGTHDLVLSTGERLTVPAVARKFLRTHLWANFAREQTDSNGVYHGDISCTVFFYAVGSAIVDVLLMATAASWRWAMLQDANARSSTKD